MSYSTIAPERIALRDYFSAMGFTAKLNELSLSVSYADEDLQSQEITQYLDRAKWSIIASVRTVEHKTDDTFDYVRILFR